MLVMIQNSNYINIPLVLSTLDKKILFVVSMIKTKLTHHNIVYKVVHSNQPAQFSGITHNKRLTATDPN